MPDKTTKARLSSAKSSIKQKNPSVFLSLDNQEINKQNVLKSNPLASRQRRNFGENMLGLSKHLQNNQTYEGIKVLELKYEDLMNNVKATDWIN